MHVTLLARAHVWHPSAGREPLRGNISQTTANGNLLRRVRITVVDRETVAKIFVCRRFALEMVCTLRNDDLRWKISFRSVRRASATLCTPARGSLLVLLSTDPQLTLSSPSQRPTHSGSIFRLLLKIAVGLPRSCDSRNFCRASALTSNKRGRKDASRPCCRGMPRRGSASQFFVLVVFLNCRSVPARRLSLLCALRSQLTCVDHIYTRPLVFARTSKDAPAAHSLVRILAVGAEALSMTPSGDALFAS